ncbi:SAM hydrolase/SAM-dependent halogenase family protein [Flavihumibacter cheonanensis]|uniref:SAM hydrolase/SAM-dependent halogenase family protein n=1 Tax=Flavihumibacter cheonanensis TaxID=1442385 RepID=UPI001EF85AA3|nr:S-adenosyl-l-methionine hydroxide adenosyltransferase family protein [Flavihumibacter cheonanensis]MCG7753938.1 S-adenosyl-l-methionine hydroxide adenosyltransferase family protein [Flavihumibacter cheonanensis]
MYRFLLSSLSCFLLLSSLSAQQPVLLYQTDFGLKDGAVAAMKGVAYSVSPRLAQYDLTHEIPAYDIWTAAYRLRQTIPFWPAGTVVVSVVDPGVGSNRRSVVAKLRTSQFIVTPDNGTLTLLAKEVGIAALRLIDEKRNRLPGSSDSYTFHGRDLYAYTAARLAAGKIRFEDIGTMLDPASAVLLPYQEAQIKRDSIQGNIPVLDEQYGNIWTNIPQIHIKQKGWKYGDTLSMSIRKSGQLVYSGKIVFGTTFSAVAAGQPVAYLNSLLNLSFGVNQGNFANQYKVSSGPDWSIDVTKVQ